MKGHVNIVKELVLLMTQEDLKMKNAKGSTALHLAAINGHLHIVKELVLLMGEEIDKDGNTALHKAVHWGKLDIVKELAQFVKPKDLKIKNNDGYTALHLAVKKENVSMVKLLGALLGEVKGPNGDTALHMAINMGAAQIVKELVSLIGKEELAVKNDEGYKAFHLAVKKGDVAIVKEFITKEKVRDFDCYIQFTTLVKIGKWDGAKDSLTGLGDPCDAITIVDPRDGCGNNALHVAAKEGNVHIVKEMMSLLLEATQVKQENLELKTMEDFVAFDWGIDLDMSDEVVIEKAKYVVEQFEKMLTCILEAQNTDGSTALHLAASKGNVDIVKELVPLMRKEGLEIQDTEGFTILLNAIENGFIDIVKVLVPNMRQEGLELKTTKKGFNALHLALRTGHMNIARELMPFMRKETLEEKDGTGYTALGRALSILKDEDVMEIVKYMTENNINKVFGIPVPPSNSIPVVVANNNNKWDVCCYLYRLMPIEYLEPKYGIHGASMIIKCLRGKKLDMALDLLRRCSKLAFVNTTPAGPPIMELARMHSAFLSGTQLGFWQHMIYNGLHIKPATLSYADTFINISRQEDKVESQINPIRSAQTLFKKFGSRLFTALGVNQLHEIKWIHTRSCDILGCISDMIRNETPTSAQFGMLKTSIFKVVEYGNVDFVTHICQAYPLLANAYEQDKNIIQFAIECRQHKVYSLIYGLDEEDKRLFGSRVTKRPENMLHLAGKLSPLSQLNRIRGAALQMQRELQWFKEVEDIVPLQMREVSNSDGMTLRELFTNHHEKLKIEAEDSMKGTATSCTVVGALIVTIMFAATFTVPGGTNNDTGSPMFLAKKLFLVFIISDTLSLVTSTTSVMVFLGILTSRYAEDDFLKNLPTKMMIGLSTLFLSIATMMIAFSSALVIMLNEEYAWAFIPIIFVASIPVVSFIWLQFPLLVEIFLSTYGPGIFHKKGKSWVKIVH